jgi:hypothetical protein
MGIACEETKIECLKTRRGSWVNSKGQPGSFGREVHPLVVA